jgi:integrase
MSGAPRDADEPLADDPFSLAVMAPPAVEALLPADIERYVEAARIAELARRGAGAAATLQAYRADWGVFVRWCATRGKTPLPADGISVAQYIRYLIDRPRRTVVERYQRPDGRMVQRERREGPATTATVRRHIVSIRKAHVLCGFIDPTSSSECKLVWKGIRRERGTKPTHQKAAVDKHKLLHAVRAIGDAHVAAAVAQLQRKLVGSPLADALARLAAGELVELGAARAAQLQRLRDHALLLLGWSGALRRGELAGVAMEHVGEEERGLHIDLPRSKTNQEGEEEYVLIHRAQDPAFCAVRAIAAWRAALATLGIEGGPLFRRVDRHGRVLGAIQGAVVNAIVKRSALAAGLDATLFGAHSLRSGWITTGVHEGRREEAMMQHSRHLSIAVFRGYVRRAAKWDDHPGLGLL